VNEGEVKKKFQKPRIEIDDSRTKINLQNKNLQETATSPVTVLAVRGDMRIQAMAFCSAGGLPWIETQFQPPAGRRRCMKDPDYGFTLM
jgi:hypothetical protein